MSEDEGQRRYLVSIDPTTKVMTLGFGKPFVWVVLQPDDARTLANVILQTLKEVEPSTPDTKGNNNE